MTMVAFLTLQVQVPSPVEWVC